MAFHDIRFPTTISRGAHGGPERRTDVITLGSGFEERNSRWADSRRAYNAGFGVKTLDDLHAVIAFFEERRGRLHGFRWRDHMDWKSCPPQQAPTALDQVIGTGDGAASTFQLTKTYGSAFAPWTRPIAKPVLGTVRIAVAGTLQTAATHYTLDPATGRISFQPGHIPAAGAAISAGYEFDVPARFDTDKLEVDIQGVRHGAIPAIPIVEIRLERNP
jgi:uncharacterized protein (TIGR02217 family)